MKILQKHFDIISEAIKPFDTDKNRAAYKAHNFTKSRYCWDCFYAATKGTTLLDELHEYLHDTHIDTALNRIVTNY